MEKIIIHEVGPRDGIQIEKKIVPTEKKIEWIVKLAKSGIKLIQVGSFVHPQKVPQMADTDKLFTELKKSNLLPHDVKLSGLVLNEKGVERGLSCGVDFFCMGMSASETHSMKNTGKTCDDALEIILRMGKQVKELGKDLQVSVQSAFGCSYDGKIPEERVIQIVTRYIEEGFDIISLADTSGFANPFQVSSLFEKLKSLSSNVRWSCHFHDANGYALANSYAAFKANVSFIESSFAGLGGCPFTAKASGNVCTEDLLEMFPNEYISGIIDSNQIAQVSADAQIFFERELPGYYYKSRGN